MVCHVFSKKVFDAYILKASYSYLAFKNYLIVMESKLLESFLIWSHSFWWVHLN